MEVLHAFLASEKKNTAAGTVKIITLLKFHYSFVACIILISYLYYTIILSNNHACTVHVVHVWKNYDGTFN